MKHIIKINGKPSTVILHSLEVGAIFKYPVGEGYYMKSCNINKDKDTVLVVHLQTGNTYSERLGKEIVPLPVGNVLTLEINR